jgi:hypothetical protein
MFVINIQFILSRRYVCCAGIYVVIILLAILFDLIDSYLQFYFFVLVQISVTLPRSPRQVRQASSSSSTTKNVGNSWKPPISANNSKRITEKNNPTRQSGTSLSNTTWENASPNIQH